MQRLIVLLAAVCLLPTAFCFAQGGQATALPVDPATKVHRAALYGGTPAAQIAACLAGVQAQGGGECDASGILGAATIAADIFSGITAPARLHLAAAYTLAVDLTVPGNITVTFGPGSSFVVNSPRVLVLAAGSVDNPDGHRIFSGTGTVEVDGTTDPRWWGGDSSGTMDSSAAITAAAMSLPTGRGDTFIPGGTFKLGSAIDLSGTYGSGSNRTIRGTGLFSTTLSLGDGANSSMFTYGAGAKSRVNMFALLFDGNKANQTVAHDCVLVGESASDETMVLDRLGVYQCKGTGLHLMTGVNRLSLRDGFFLNNDVAGVKLSDSTTQDVFSSGNLHNFNTYGLLIQPTQKRAEFQLYTSVGDHFETNSAVNIRAEDTQGLNVLGGYSYHQGTADAYLGPQVRQSHFLYSQSLAGINDAGFFNVVRDQTCASSIYTKFGQGQCALRNKFPILEQALDPSIVSDWDMESAGLTAWTAGAGATRTKTAWLNHITGDRYLRLVCSSAPCEVTQDIADTISASAYFSALYTATTENAVAGFQIRRSDTDAVLVDSGWLIAPNDGNARPPYRWTTTAALAAGSWRIALRCNSTTEACVFGEVRLIRNYVLEPSFEDTTAGWTSQYGSCVKSATRSRTGTYSYHCTNAAIYQTLMGLPSSGYALLRASVYVETGTVHFGWGSVWNGAQTDNFYDFRTARAAITTGEWNDFQLIVRLDDFGGTGQRLAFGEFTGTNDFYVDDVSAVLLSSSETGNPTFATLAVNGPTTLRNTLGVAGLTSLTGGFTSSVPLASAPAGIFMVTGGDNSSIEALRAGVSGTGAQNPYFGLYSNAALGPKFGADNYWQTVYIDHAGSGATRFSMRLRGTEYAWLDTAGQFAATTFTANGSGGQSLTITVRDAAGTGTCTITFTGGLKTGGTC